MGLGRRNESLLGMILPIRGVQSRIGTQNLTAGPHLPTNPFHESFTRVRTYRFPNTAVLHYVAADEPQSHTLLGP